MFGECNFNPQLVWTEQTVFVQWPYFVLLLLLWFLSSAYLLQCGPTSAMRLRIERNILCWHGQGTVKGFLATSCKRHSLNFLKNSIPVGHSRCCLKRKLLSAAVIGWFVYSAFVFCNITPEKWQKLLDIYWRRRESYPLFSWFVKKYFLTLYKVFSNYIF